MGSSSLCYIFSGNNTCAYSCSHIKFTGKALKMFVITLAHQLTHIFITVFSLRLYINALGNLILFLKNYVNLNICINFVLVFFYIYKFGDCLCNTFDIKRDIFYTVVYCIQQGYRLLHSCSTVIRHQKIVVGWSETLCV